MISNFISLIRVAFVSLLDLSPVLYIFFGVMFIVSMWNLIWYFVKGSY